MIMGVHTYPEWIGAIVNYYACLILFIITSARRSRVVARCKNNNGKHRKKPQSFLHTCTSWYFRTKSKPNNQFLAVGLYNTLVGMKITNVHRQCPSNIDNGGKASRYAASNPYYILVVGTQGKLSTVVLIPNLRSDITHPY